MASPAPKRKPDPKPPPVDYEAVPRAFVTHRARRAARERHEYEIKRGWIRFLLLLVALIFVGFLLSFSIWDEIQSLFGLGT
ncbi:MAG: hypothetical protein ACE5EV_03240 [Gaiellales bacterium]